MDKELQIPRPEASTPTSHPFWFSFTICSLFCVYVRVYFCRRGGGGGGGGGGRSVPYDPASPTGLSTGLRLKCLQERCLRLEDKISSESVPSCSQ